tara:strand:+ start:2096 stop:2383 length:288 start_codon:yes stop_codon:yes gene_type:complete
LDFQKLKVSPRFLLIIIMDIYRHIVSFMEESEIPIVNREFIKGYVHRKWRRLNGIPLLVDILWHSPMMCHKYCVCKVANENDRIIYYNRRRRNSI